MRQVDETLEGNLDTNRLSVQPGKRAILPGLSSFTHEIDHVLMSVLTRVFHAGRVVSDVLEKVRGINPE